MRRHGHTFGAAPERIAAVWTKWRRLAAAAIVGGAAMHGVDAGAGDVYLRAGMKTVRPRPCSRIGMFERLTGGALRLGPRRCDSVGDFGTVHARTRARLYRRARSRLELLAEYRRLAFEGHANFLEPGRQQSVAADVVGAMLAAYVDLPGLTLPRIGPIVPFLGAGVGAARTRIGETRMTFPKTTTVVPGASRTDFAWMLTAGVAVSLNERMTLDLAWRHTDIGEVHTGQGAGRVVWRDGSRAPLPLDLAAPRAKLASHGLRLSLRYAF